jgi:hypothetical protein
VRSLLSALAFFVFVGSSSSDTIEIRVVAGKVDLEARGAPLAQLLDRLARQTRMRVVYDGSPPHDLVTASLVGRSPAEAVLSVLEGRGLNFALALDRTGQRVETLVLTHASPPLPPSEHSVPFVPPPPEGEADDMEAQLQSQQEGAPAVAAPESPPSAAPPPSNPDPPGFQLPPGFGTVPGAPGPRPVFPPPPFAPNMSPSPSPPTPSPSPQPKT